MLKNSMNAEQYATLRSGNNALLARLSFVAALSPLLFALAFFVLLPALGLDMERFGDPSHVLEVFGNNAFLMRLIIINNYALMVCAGTIALQLPKRLSVAPSEKIWIAAGINSLGWILYLGGELFDFTAYISLPNMDFTQANIAFQSFLTLQHTGRMFHTFAYLCVGVGMLGLSLSMRGNDNWPKKLWVVGVLASCGAIITFLIEYLYTSLSGDSGAAGIFNVVLALDTLLLSIWYGWIWLHTRHHGKGA